MREALSAWIISSRNEDSEASESSEIMKEQTRNLQTELEIIRNKIEALNLPEPQLSNSEKNKRLLI
jgi:hypothetical protein